MFTVLSFMLLGMLLGFILRHRGANRVSRLITPLIWLLLFLLGTSVGSDQTLMAGLWSLGVDALWITIGAVTGSLLLSWALWRWLESKGGVQ